MNNTDLQPLPKGISSRNGTSGTPNGCNHTTVCTECAKRLGQKLNFGKHGHRGGTKPDVIPNQGGPVLHVTVSHCVASLRRYACVASHRFVVGDRCAASRCICFSPPENVTCNVCTFLSVAPRRREFMCFALFRVDSAHVANTVTKRALNHTQRKQNNCKDCAPLKHNNRNTTAHPKSNGDTTTNSEETRSESNRQTNV